jgi:hypothetical protein
LTAMAFLVVIPGTRPKLTWNVLKLYTPIVPCFGKSAYHVPRPRSSTRERGDLDPLPFLRSRNCYARNSRHHAYRPEYREERGREAQSDAKEGRAGEARRKGQRKGRGGCGIDVCGGGGMRWGGVCEGWVLGWVEAGWVEVGEIAFGPKQYSMGTCERASSHKSPGSTLGPGFDSAWERISQDLTVFVLSVVGHVPVDSEVPLVTLSILTICRHSLRRCS